MVSLERVLSSENTPAPLSMFNEDGSLIACVKSDFLHNFERMCETEVTKMETTHCIIIGIKHGIPCINVCQVPREMLKTEAVGRGFQHLPRDRANVNVLENHV